MARTKGAKNKITIAVKDAVENAFTTVNDGGKYLVWLSKEHPAAFVSLVGKCIPAAVAVSVTLQFDLLSAMNEANNNAQRLNDTSNTIDVTPEPLNTPKPLITKDK
jgi:hypothetical protein